MLLGQDVHGGVRVPDGAERDERLPEALVRPAIGRRGPPASARARGVRGPDGDCARARRRKTEEQMRFFKEQWVALRCPETGFEPRLRDDDDAPR